MTNVKRVATSFFPEIHLNLTQDVNFICMYFINLLLYLWMWISLPCNEFLTIVLSSRYKRTVRINVQCIVVTTFCLLFCVYFSWLVIFINKSIIIPVPFFPLFIVTMDICIKTMEVLALIWSKYLIREDNKCKINHFGVLMHASIRALNHVKYKNVEIFYEGQFRIPWKF